MGAALQPPLIIGIAGTLVGVLMALFSLELSRLPGWQHSRRFALVAITSAGYCACDLVLVSSLPPSTIAFGVQCAILFGVANGAAWLWYLAALEGRPIDRFEQSFGAIAIVVGIASLIPGAVMTSDLATVRIEWFDAVYQTPRPTLIGAVVFLYLAAAITIVAVRAARRNSASDRSRPLVAGVAVLGILAVNDTLVSAGKLEMPLMLDAGAVIVMLVAGLRSQRRLAEELRLTQDALTRSERLASTGRLAAGIAHEINNPAAVIRHDFEQILARSGDPAVLAAHGLGALQRIVTVVKRLLDLGSIARPELGVLGPFAIAPVVARSAELLSTRLPPQTLMIEVEPELTAVGDPSRLESVLVNLLSNAAYAVDRVAAPRVRVRAERHGELVTIAVSDNGPGVPREILDRLFEPYVNTQPFGQGSGLGLAVSHGLMRSQHGTLRLVQTSPQGTEMAVELPYATPAAEATAPARLPEAPLMSLLIIDDDPDLRLVLREAAAAHQMTAVAAATVADALHLVESGALIDVVLCDLMMPDGGAETWLHVCREKYPVMARRTIIITGGPSSPSALGVADANTDRLLYKPFSMSDVRVMASRILRTT